MTSSDHSPVSALDALSTTRAIRRYRPEPIPEDDLAQILFAATRAPTGSNRQPFRFVVLTDGDGASHAKRLLGNTFRANWSDKRAGDGYDSGSGVHTDTPKARMARTMQHFVDHFEDTPAVVLACIRPRHNNMVDGASIYPACQNLLIAARALGYGGVLTAWHHQAVPALRDALAIPDDVEIAAVIPLGQPVGTHGPVRRRPMNELVFADRWNETADWITDPEGTEHTSSGPNPMK